MAKVLVTGASGFLGQHLVRQLTERGERVSCLVRPTSQSEPLTRMGARLVTGDVLDPESLGRAIEGADIVYHLAGITQALRSRDLHRVNASGSENVARACAARTTPPVLLVVSSLAAAGPSTSERPRQEADPVEPVSHYGSSKRAAELAVAGRADSLPVTILRPPIVLGEGDWKGVALFRPIARWGIHAVPGLSEMPVSVMHAADLATAMILAAERGERVASPGSGEESRGYYFVEAEARPDYGELGRMIGRAAGRRVLVVRLPRACAYVVGAGGQVTGWIRRSAPIVNLDKAREAAAGCWTCSGARIEKQLGFAPERPLADRLAQTLGWYQEKGWV